MNIRGKAIVVFEHQEKFLFTVCFDKITNDIFYIPVGGGIEFGEYSIDAAKREVLEEIGQEIDNVQLLNVSENIFKFNGINEHEIVFIYKASFKDPQAYHHLNANKNDKGETIAVIWAPLSEINKNKIKTYPEGLLQILETYPQ